VAVGEYLREQQPESLSDLKLRKHFHHGLFHGFDFDNTMLRIGSMNLLLHGVENPDVVYRDSLSQDYSGEEEKYTLVLANPPFAGSLDYENTAKDLLQMVKTKKTELLFLSLFLRLLKPGGRAAVIVPEGVLFGSTNAHKTVRQILVADQKLDAVISLPAGVFRPYAGVSTAILIFTKTNSGGTDFVWFYDVEADGWSLDDKRTALLADEKLGAVPKARLTPAEQAENNLPDVLTRWHKRSAQGRGRPRTAQSFCVRAPRPFWARVRDEAFKEGLRTAEKSKRVREATGTADYRAAQQKLTQRLGAIDKGEIILTNKKLLVSDLYAGLERDYKENGRKTLTDLKGRWNNHLKAFFADMLAVNVTEDRVKDYRAKRIEEGAKRASINREVAVIKKAFHLAQEKLPRLPRFPTQLEEDPARDNFIGDVEFAALTANVGTDELWLRCFLEVAYAWGWRVSEILALRVKQVDLKQRTVRLGPGTTKSGEPREGMMNDKIAALLTECCDGKSKTDYVLTRANGGHIRSFRRRWEKLCEKAELPGLLVHDFRRSAAKNFRNAGVAESVIMDLCGWSTAEMFRRYRIVAPKDKRNAMLQLDAQRALDKLKLEQEQAEAEAENSHKVGHSRPQNAVSGNATENSNRREWKQ
jgi:integrase